MLGRRAESHDFLDAGAVVPGAVEQHDLAFGGQLRYVALVIPLSAFTIGRRRKRGNARDARVEIFGDPFDGAALARPVTALEDHDDASALGSHPFLHLHQFRLQPEQFGLIHFVG